MTEAESFEQFMRDYQNMVFSTAVRLLVNEAEAKDVSQEVFLKAYERFSELQHSPTVGGWLRKVTTNLCLNHLSRYRNRWRFFSEMFCGDEGGDEVAFENTLVAESSTDGEARSSDDRAQLEATLQELPPAQRIPLVLYHFEDFSYEEIAAMTKTTLAKVKTDIFRGREALRKKLRIRLAQDEDGCGAVDMPRGGVSALRASLLQQPSCGI